MDLPTLKSLCSVFLTLSCLIDVLDIDSNTVEPCFRGQSRRGEVTKEVSPSFASTEALTPISPPRPRQHDERYQWESL